MWLGLICICVLEDMWVLIPMNTFIFVITSNGRRVEGVSLTNIQSVH